MALSHTDLMVSQATTTHFTALTPRQQLIWTLWGVSFFCTILRGFLRWKSQHRLFADDYFVFFGLFSLTALSAVITCLLPQFFLAQEYSKAAILDPLTPLPLPPDEFIERTRTSLKFMFSQMLLFWTTLWAGGLARYTGEQSILLICRFSQVLHSFLLQTAGNRTASIHACMVGVLRTSPTPLSRMHRLQLPNLPPTIQVLERKSVLFHPVLLRKPF